MGRVPTRKHSGLAFSESPVADHARSEIASLLGEPNAMPYAHVRSVHVFALRGERGVGLLAERDEHLADEPGVYRTTISVYVVERSPAPGVVFELLTHSWDAGTYAGDTGDRTWLDVARAQMYAERDRRTAAVGQRLDQLTAFQLPPGGVPALNAGLTPDEVDLFAKGIAS